MAFKDFLVGDLVWAKMKSYPPWPAKIENPPSGMMRPAKTEESHYVYFFGSEDYAWIPDKHITPHTESVLKTLGNKKSPAFRKAVSDFISFAKDPKKEKLIKDVTSIDKKDEIKVSSNVSSLKISKRSFKDVKDSDTLIGEIALNVKRTKPSKNFGFIGLGNMGRAIVKNLIESGHDVTVWNRHSYKYSAVQRAKKAESPADLVMKCDIIFCCVSDSDASKAVIFDYPQGILKGFEQTEMSSESRKAYVEMTTLDAQSSLEICDAINRKGGLYLEAPLFGTNKSAEDGTLLIVASGDRRVFTHCESCFQAVTQNAFYLSCEVGSSTQIGLLLTMLSGTLYVAVAEFMVLAEKLKVPKEHLLKLLGLGPLNCNAIMQKMHMFQHRRFSIHTPVFIHRDVNMSLTSADDFSQPMPVTAAANEVFKLSRCLGYSENDPGAVYKTLCQ